MKNKKFFTLLHLMYAIVWATITASGGFYIGMNYSYEAALILTGLSAYFLGVFLGTFLGKQQVDDYD